MCTDGDNFYAWNTSFGLGQLELDEMSVNAFDVTFLSEPGVSSSSSGEDFGFRSKFSNDMDTLHRHGEEKSMSKCYAVTLKYSESQFQSVLCSDWSDGGD